MDLSDIYFLDSDIMLFTQFAEESQSTEDVARNNILGTTEHKLSSLEHIVELNDDVYEIVPVDPLAECNNYNGSHEDIPYAYVPDGHQVNEGLAVLEILYNHPIDQPEYIDINDLTTPLPCNQPLAVIDVSEDNDQEDEDDDDDDVIFVKEYKSDVNGDGANTNSVTGPRRNPVRKARKSSKILTRELLYDEDYAIMESSSDEEILCETLRKSARSNSTLTVKDYKKWPVSGLHERPEYNDSTKQLEKFDYTIRQIKNSVLSKKPPPKIPRKPTRKRKYVPRKKSSTKPDVEEKVLASELRQVVESTLDSVKQYVRNLKTGNEIITKGKDKAEEVENVSSCEPSCSSELECSTLEYYQKGESSGLSENILKGLEILKNQFILYQVLCSANQQNVMKCFNEIS